MPRKKTNKAVPGAVRNAVASTREKIEDIRDFSEKKVKDSPFLSVTIAAAVGAVVGFGISLLLTPRRKTFLERLRDQY